MAKVICKAPGVIMRAGGNTLSPPKHPTTKGKVGRFCVKVSTGIIGRDGTERMRFKGYGPEEEIILQRTVSARDRHARPDESVTEPLITTLCICDVCDNRIEVCDLRTSHHYYI